MSAWVNAILTFSHNHIKITIKLQKNHHSEPPEIYPNRNPTTKDIKKKPHETDRRRGGNREWAGPTPTCGR